MWKAASFPVQVLFIISLKILNIAIKYLQETEKAIESHTLIHIAYSCYLPHTHVMIWINC